jgi:hypothetical protein
MLKGLVIAAGLVAVPVTTAVAAECPAYGTMVTLEGRYAHAVIAASATGSQNPAGIPGRTADLLILDAPLCVAANAISGGVLAALDIQLNCPELVLEGGEAVEITGRLFGAHTGNGHTPVLLVCNQ